MQCRCSKVSIVSRQLHRSEWRAERRGGAKAAAQLKLVFLELNHNRHLVHGFSGCVRNTCTGSKVQSFGFHRKQAVASIRMASRKARRRTGGGATKVSFQGAVSLLLYIKWSFPMPHRSSPVLSVEHTQVRSGINWQTSRVTFCDQSEWWAERRGGVQAAAQLKLVS